MRFDKKTFWLSSGLSLALALPLTISCGRNSGDGVERLAATAANETQLLEDLHKDNQKEIALAKLATQRAQSPEVKDFAKQLVADHEKADKRVTELQKKLGGTTQPTTPAAPAAPSSPSTPSTPGGTGGTSRGNPGAAPAAPSAPGTPAAPSAPSTPSDPHSAMLEQLRTLRGLAFDKKFVDLMITGHQEGIAKLQAAQSSITNKDVQALVKDLLPVWEKHLKAAQQLQEKLGGSPEEGTGKGKFGKGKLQEQGKSPLPLPPEKGEGNGMQEQGKKTLPSAPTKPKEGGSLGKGEQQQFEGQLPTQPKQPTTPPAGGMKKQPGTPSTPSLPSKPVKPGSEQGGESQGGQTGSDLEGFRP